MIAYLLARESTSFDCVWRKSSPNSAQADASNYAKNSWDSSPAARGLSLRQWLSLRVGGFVRLRGYREGDLEAMYRLDRVCFPAAFQFDRKIMREMAESDSAVVVVAEDETVVAAKDETDAGIAGFVIVHLEGEPPEQYGYIVTIDVAPAMRRRGIAAKLLADAEMQISDRGAGRIGLHVATNNADAIPFYERQGYQQTGTAKRFYRQAGVDAFVYTKRLAKPRSSVLASKRHRGSSES